MRWRKLISGCSVSFISYRDGKFSLYTSLIVLCCVFWHRSCVISHPFTVRETKEVLSLKYKSFPVCFFTNGKFSDQNVVFVCVVFEFLWERAVNPVWLWCWTWFGSISHTWSWSISERRRICWSIYHFWPVATVIQEPPENCTFLLFLCLATPRLVLPAEPWAILFC